MIEAEPVLLEAVLGRLRSVLSLSEKQADVELDDQVPAIATDTYYAVMPAGFRKGDHHDRSGGVWDLVFSVKVAVYQRMTEVARDRRRVFLMDRFKALSKLLTDVITIIDFDYNVINDANQGLVTTGASAGKFLEPLRVDSGDSTCRPIFIEPYDAAPMDTELGDPTIALMRSVTFGGARYLRVRDRLTRT